MYCRKYTGTESCVLCREVYYKVVCPNSDQSLILITSTVSPSQHRKI